MRTVSVEQESGAAAELELADRELGALIDRGLRTLVDCELGALVDRELRALPDRELRAVVDRELGALVDRELRALADDEFGALVDRELRALADRELGALVDRELRALADESELKCQPHALRNWQAGGSLRRESLEVLGHRQHRGQGTGSCHRPQRV
jgi:hypothetical protein